MNVMIHDLESDVFHQYFLLKVRKTGGEFQ